MARLITSQDHLDETIVAEKQAACDYDVLVSPEFVIDGETFQVVIDGHHSLAAAIADAVQPEILIATKQDCDAIALLDSGNAQAFLEAVYHGHDYRDAITGEFIW